MPELSDTDWMQAQACWIEAPGHAALRAAQLAAPGPGEVLVRALHSGISRGTEMLVFGGRVPQSEYQRMRAPFQEGDFPGPVKYGYASVGVVEQGPDDLRGRAVFCLHPHQSRYVVPASAVHALPDGLPPARAVLAANMETAVNALWDASPRVGDRIAVVGGGVVGLLVAWLAARLPDCHVQLVDTHAPRAQLARHLGLDFARPDDAAPEADLVVHASGNSQGLATALGLAAFEATVLELSWYGQQPVSLPLGEAFHARRLTLRSSQVGHVATAQRARWTHARRMALALSLLRDERLDALVTGHAPFAQLPQVLERLAAGSPDTLCQRIDY
ncbi:zinc-binding alcohol dehydrogenase [Variovorax sp. OV329]|uniref:zinc-dependent alcohol dehydrogenase n=1 Tax=Variovorax sp. OV329 TaxID=1882825 RepID=UPI0008E743F6|nr:zinc-binding alcohol dehydrogenase [Variovorax sp. OV329]SFN03812.1 2-desacetyl-2-hydroxyethyl bacteriochlorophyllide A dehydrogenase [Variovorax sp. OV329]